MDDLIAFLRARWDTEARDAQELLDYNQESRTSTGFGSTLWDEQDLEARWTLRDVEAKRKILDLHGSNEYGVCGVCVLGTDAERRPCLTIRLLAEPHADHADYREEWRP